MTEYALKLLSRSRSQESFRLNAYAQRLLNESEMRKVKDPKLNCVSIPLNYYESHYDTYENCWVF